MVLEAVQGSVAERSFEASVYHPMVKATVAAQKLDVVTMHLESIQKQLQQGYRANQGATAGVAGLMIPAEEQQSTHQQQQQQKQQQAAGNGNGMLADAAMAQQQQPMQL